MGYEQVHRDGADLADADQGSGGHAGLANDSAGEASPIAALAITDTPPGVSDGHSQILAAMAGSLQSVQGKVPTSQPQAGQLATPWLPQGYRRLRASQSAVSRTHAIPVEPGRTSPPMATLTVIEPVDSSRTELRRINQRKEHSDRV
jgi:hypothetical protein